MSAPTDHPVVDPHIHQWEPHSTPRLVSPAVRLLDWNPALMRRALQLVASRAAAAFVGKPDHVLSAYLPGSWRRDTGDWNVRGFVHVEAGWHDHSRLGAVGETRWLEELCGVELLGIVGHADLDSPHLAEVLDAHAAASPRFVGVRDMVAWSAEPGVHCWTARGGRLSSPEWRAGYAALGQRGLTFDAFAYQPQLRELHELARRHPETRLVLDHVGTPIGLGGSFAGRDRSEAQRADLARRWHDDLSRLAELPHVHVKLSGLAMPITGFGWHERERAPSQDEVVDRLGPHLEHALAAFGPDRAMFASNFPMDKVSLPWTTLFGAYAELTRSLELPARRALFHDTAVRFYGLAQA